nr:hypothetical protein [uncultured Acetatifactor sp.]
MEYVKKAAPYLDMVLRGMIFMGFSVQIVLGICWICGNFGQVQGFGEPDSRLYGALLRLLGEKPWAAYSLQLAAAFFAGYLFMQKLQPAAGGFAAWRGLALLTFPFALQCHLSLQPYSLMSSVFLLLLLALLKLCRKQAAALLAAAVACAAVFTGLSGAFDADRQEKAGYSLEGALARRFAWPTLWNDFGRYGEELAEILQPVAWDASLSPDDMGLLQERLESRVGVEAAKEYYLQMARTGWEYHASGVMRQIGWDVLGYAATPLIFPMQMEGKGYDSCSGRNYEVMRERTPVLTRDYVDYGCWWFGWMLVLSFFLCLIQARPGKSRKKIAMAIGICFMISGILILGLTMRGAGKMDYRQTIAVNALWYMAPLLLMGRGRPEKIAGSKNTSGQKGI